MWCILVDLMETREMLSLQDENKNKTETETNPAETRIQKIQTPPSQRLRPNRQEAFRAKNLPNPNKTAATKTKRKTHNSRKKIVLLTAHLSNQKPHHSKIQLSLK
uniref:Uncharacterized protein n=1 Tax=Cacopsylla melanoneura TaxID=428564 RepID=A0A8D8WLZ9_9HEMI